MSFQILCIGDVVGQPGRLILEKKLSALRRERSINCIVCNGENAAAGSGVTPKVLGEMLAAGVDIVTTGDHVYKNRDGLECINNPRLVRPLNYPDTAAGKGATVFEAQDGTRVLVANLIGQVFMGPADNPFVAVDRLLAQPPAPFDLAVVDFHAEATSEKVAMGWHLDGRVAVLVGTHTHIQTADERILPNGTAYITDLGMTGAYASVLGRDIEPVLQSFRTQMPARFTVAENDVRLSGVLVSVDVAAKRAISIERIMLSA